MSQSEYTRQLSAWLKWILVILIIPFMMACDNSAKKMKLPSLESAPEQLGGN